MFILDFAALQIRIILTEHFRCLSHTPFTPRKLEDCSSNPRKTHSQCCYLLVFLVVHSLCLLLLCFCSVFALFLCSASRKLPRFLSSRARCPSLLFNLHRSSPLGAAADQLSRALLQPRRWVFNLHHSIHSTLAPPEHMRCGFDHRLNLQIVNISKWQKYCYGWQAEHKLDEHEI